MVDLSLEMARLVAENMHLQKELRKNMIAQMNLVQSYQPLFEDYYAGNQKETVWHPASEEPEHKEGKFLARAKDGHPFITTFIGQERYWITNVHEWMYIPE